MSLQLEIDALNALTHKLLHLGLDGTPIYADSFSALNAEVYRQSELLFPRSGDTPEEEASLCIALLRGYGATIYDYGDKEQKKQSVLDRSWTVLEQLSTSLLKCKLLVDCYSEVLEEDLAKEAYLIISSWDKQSLSDEWKEVIGKLMSLEDCLCKNHDLE